MEPWDGPAAICAYGGRWVIAGMDRNGLRPLRYAVTNDGLLIVGSEAGMVTVDETKVGGERPRRSGTDDRGAISPKDASIATGSSRMRWPHCARSASG